MLGHFYSYQYLNHIKVETKTKLHVIEYEKYFIPIFEYMLNQKHSCYNSSPFYCSHGGFSSENINKDHLQFDYYHKINSLADLSILINPNDTVSFTTISNPYWTDPEKKVNSSFIDYLRGNFNMKYHSDDKLSTVVNLHSDNRDEIFGKIHSKHRNAIRKFLSSDYNIEKLNFASVKWKYCISELIEYNKLISEKGGVPKMATYFETISNYFYHDQYFIYRACNNNDEMLASCLFFENNGTLEYWTPIISDQGRICNALQGLMFEVMQREAKNVSSINLGGTNPENTNLKRFKERFGGESNSYTLHNFMNEDLINQYNLAELIKQNPYFYFWKKQ